MRRKRSRIQKSHGSLIIESYLSVIILGTMWSVLGMGMIRINNQTHEKFDRLEAYRAVYEMSEQVKVNKEAQSYEKKVRKKRFRCMYLSQQEIEVRYGKKQISLQLLQIK